MPWTTDRGGGPCPLLVRKSHLERACTPLRPSATPLWQESTSFPGHLTGGSHSPERGGTPATLCLSRLRLDVLHSSGRTRASDQGERQGAGLQGRHQPGSHALAQASSRGSPAACRRESGAPFSLNPEADALVQYLLDLCAGAPGT